jgi:hypothetical protein
VAIAANTVYVASYHAESGFFALDSNFFSAAGVDAPPLHALQAGVDGPNGVFLYGAGGFPAGGGANNYWVDVVVQTNLGPDTTRPTVVSTTPASNATDVPLATAVTATWAGSGDRASVSGARGRHLLDAARRSPDRGQRHERHAERRRANRGSMEPGGGRDRASVSARSAAREVRDQLAPAAEAGLGEDRFEVILNRVG